MTATHRPRLLIAEDHPGTSRLLRGLLELEYDVIADVRDGYALVGAVECLSPDLIVSDISMPGLDGIAAADAILHRHPEARIVFVTVNDDACLMERGLETGALGYVLKISVGDDLMPAVCAALRGERFVSASLRCPRQS